MCFLVFATTAISTGFVKQDDMLTVTVKDNHEFWYP